MGDHADFFAAVEAGDLPRVKELLAADPDLANRAPRSHR